MIDLDREPKVRQFTGARGSYSGSLLWSPDSKELAIIAKDESSSVRPQVLRCAVASGMCRAAAPASIKLPLKVRNVVRKPPYVWLSGERLLIQGEPSEGMQSERGNESQWWIAEPDGAARPWASGIPGQSGARSSWAIGWQRIPAIVDGSIWCIDEHGVPRKELAPTLKGQVSAITIPFGDFSTRAGNSSLIHSQATRTCTSWTEFQVK